MSKFLRDGIRDKSEDNVDGLSIENKCEAGGCSDANELNNFIECKSDSLALSQIDASDMNINKNMAKLKSNKIQKNLSCGNASTAKAVVDDDGDTQEKLAKSCESQSYTSTSSINPPKKKAKLLRIERKKDKLASKGLEMPQKVSKNYEKSLSDFINEEPANSKHKLEVRKCLAKYD